MDMQGSELFYNLYTGSLLAENEFVEPYARSCDYVIISLEVLRLLYRYAYNMDSDYIKFTIGLVVETSSGIYRLTVGKAIPLFDSNGKPLPKALVYDMILRTLMEYAGSIRIA